MLDAATVAIIKATVPALKAHGEEITRCFYPLMFERYPEVIPYFNQSHQGSGSQARALANAVIAYGANIDALGNLDSAVSRIVHKHCALGIQPHQYDIVGECLLAAIAEVLGEAAIFSFQAGSPGNSWRALRSSEAAQVVVRVRNDNRLMTRFSVQFCDLLGELAVPRLKSRDDFLFALYYRVQFAYV